MDPSILSQVLGPFGALVLAVLVAYGFFSGRLRPGKDYDDCRQEVKEKDARYATIVPALENFGRGSEAVVNAVTELDTEVTGFNGRLQTLEKQHAEQVESLKAHYKIEMDALRADVAELVRVVGDLNGDVRVIQAAVERIDSRGVGPWKGGTR